jgi:hypothetical protein
MNQKTCRYCSMLILKDAKICPHCGKKLGWSWPVKVLVGMAILVTLSFIMGRKNPDVPQAQRPVAKPIETISITSRQLYKEYEDNQILADTKYKGKTVKVSGEIRDIGKSILGKPYLNLATGTFSHQVMITYPADKYNQQLATLKQGDAIEVIGTCTGQTLGMVGISVK